MAIPASARTPAVELGVRAIFGLLGAALLWQLGVVWLGRLFHPFDLEWMEGGMLAHAWRLQQGLPIYVEPGVDFIPFVYPPGYVATLLGLSQLFGLDYLPGRALSIASTLVAASAAVFAVRRFGHLWLPALAAGLCFLGCYSASGLFYDLVRADALAIALLGWAIALGLEEDRRLLGISALLIALAATVKVQAAVFGLPLMLGIWTRDGWRSASYYLLLAALPALCFAGWMQWRSNGLFLRWVLLAPASHGYVWSRAFPGAPAELAGPLGLALAAIAALVTRQTGRCVSWLGPTGAYALAVGLAALGCCVGLLVDHDYTVTRLAACIGLASTFSLCGLGALWGLELFRHGQLSARWIAASGLLVIGLLAGALSRAHIGGFVNVLIPTHWVLAVGFGAVLARLSVELPRSGALLAAALASLQVAIQLPTLDPSRQTPSQADRAAGERWVEQLRRVEGPVLSPFAAWLPFQAGHPPSLHHLGMTENTKKGSVFPGTRETLREAFGERHWKVVVAGSKRLGFGMARSYEAAPDLVEVADDAFWPRSGWRVRPERLMIPRPENPSPSAAR